LVGKAGPCRHYRVSALKDLIKVKLAK